MAVMSETVLESRMTGQMHFDSHVWVVTDVACHLVNALTSRAALASAGLTPCDRVYVNTLYNLGKRFCSTRCQSRVKAAAHRAKSMG